MKASVIISIFLVSAAGAAVDRSKKNQRDLWDDLVLADDVSFEDYPKNQKFLNFPRDPPPLPEPAASKRPSNKIEKEDKGGHKMVSPPQPKPEVKHIRVPYPVEVEKKVPVIVEKKVRVIVEKKVPVHIDRPVPYPVEVEVPVVQKEYVEVPYPVHIEKKVPVFINKPVYIQKTVPVIIQIRRKKNKKRW